MSQRNRAKGGGVSGKGVKEEQRDGRVRGNGSKSNRGKGG